MKKILQHLTVSAAVAALILNPSVMPARAAKAREVKQPIIQIALLLDTSNSMDGLIDQARGQLWKVVNEFSHAKQNGRHPEVWVALSEYGNNGLDGRAGWIRQVLPLTTDLDKVSEELFKLKTNGGEEYCGWAIRDAVAKLDWSHSPDVYRAVFIAGNEPFTQGPVSYAESCQAAITKGIVVNTIHCGNEADGIRGKWQEGAQLADGRYMVIDQNRAVVHFEAPQDREISRLGVELNKTYLAYGAAGRLSAERQSAQDANALALAPSGAAYNRALTKASTQYRNETWDLVDALKSDSKKLAELKKEELPAEMQKMNEGERKAYVDTKAKERMELQTRIQALNAERNKYVAARMKQQAATNTLDTVMITTVREQAARRNYRFE